MCRLRYQEIYLQDYSYEADGRLKDSCFAELADDNDREAAGRNEVATKSNEIVTFSCRIILNEHPS
jgi:hypothetical protein